MVNIVGAGRKLLDDVKSGAVHPPTHITLAQAEKFVRDRVGFDIGQQAFNLVVQGVIETSRLPPVA